jgi:protein TonB
MLGSNRMHADGPDSTRARWGASYLASLLLHGSGAAVLLLLGLAPLASLPGAARNAPPTIVIEPLCPASAEPARETPEREWEVADAPPAEEPEFAHEELATPAPMLEPERAEPLPEDLAHDPWADVPLTLVLTPRPPAQEPPAQVEEVPASAPHVAAREPVPRSAAFHSSPVPIAGACKRPPYPERAARLGWQGLVVCRVTVAADGSVVRVTVEESSGRKLLDEAALRALETWRFVPGKRGDDPVQMDWIKRVEFRIE